MGRIPIRGIRDRSSVSRIIGEHVSGERKVRPLLEYQSDPLGFLVDVLTIPRSTLVWSEHPGYVTHQWDGTPDPLVRACDVLSGKIPGKKHVAIEAATGTQKTFTAAGLVLWFLACFEDSLVVTTAPMERQLKQNLWKEIGVHLVPFKKRFPRAQSLDLKIRMRPVLEDPMTGNETRQEKWAAVGWTAGVDAGADSAVRSQGFHAEHMLIVVEEFPGMDPSIVTALKNTATAPHNILLGLGNPDHQLDPLHQFSELPSVEAIRISAFDHPNVVCQNPSIVPGATSQAFIDEKRAEYGETGPLFLSRVRGLSPREAHNALIKAAWLEEAARKWDDVALHEAMADGPLALGVDPAQSENGDRCALARWSGSVLERVERIPSRDALAFGEYVWDVMQEDGVRPEHVAVDSVGVGSNVVNYLRRVLPPGPSIRVIEGGAEDPIEGAMKAAVATMAPGREYQADANQFLNMRAQVYWQLAQDLAAGLVAMPKHAGLWRELMAPTYSTEDGVVRIEKKASIVKKLGRSPDFADAVVYGNFVRPRTLRATGRRKPEVLEGKSPGYDYDAHRPRERMTAEDEVELIFSRANTRSALAGRYQVPRR